MDGIYILLDGEIMPENGFNFDCTRTVRKRTQNIRFN